MALPPQPAQPPAPPDAGVTFATFSGLKNTVPPELLTGRELARAQNVDLDDLGGLHRRRGRRRVAIGNWHSIFSIPIMGLMFGVKDGTLVKVNPDFSTVPLKTGMGSAQVDFEQIGPTLYFNSLKAAGQIELMSLTVTPWAGPAGGADFWFSPVVRPEATLGQVGGRLFGPPPLGSYLASQNGRMFIGAGRTLWATELFLYNYVDKNKGYKLFESNITGLQSVEDGLYVGTEDDVYFLTGNWSEQTRKPQEVGAVIPGSMIAVPGEVIDPEGRRFPDIPRQTSTSMVCMTSSGVVAGLPNGVTYNLTRSQFIFPAATRAAAMVRQEDGMNTLVLPTHSGGDPVDNARFGDHLSAVLIRGGVTPTTNGA